MTDLQKRSSRKMTELREIKQELSNTEENEGDFVKSVTSLNHFNHQLNASMKQEESSTSEAEDSVHLNNMTSLTCQVKKEPESEEDGGYELESKGDTDYVHEDEEHTSAVTAEDHISRPSTSKGALRKRKRAQDEGPAAEDEFAKSLTEATQASSSAQERIANNLRDMSEVLKEIAETKKRKVEILERFYGLANTFVHNFFQNPQT